MSDSYRGGEEERVLHIATALGAALAFTIGGIFMKPSHGLTRPLPTLAVLGLFAIGALLMILSAESRGELGAAYVVRAGPAGGRDGPHRTGHRDRPVRGRLHTPAIVAGVR